MPIQIKSEMLHPGSTCTFNFDDIITQRMVGFSEFSLTYGNTDHHVQTMSISLSVNQSGNSLTVMPHVKLVDGNGHNLDPDSSTILVVAIAWIGVDDPNLKLTNVMSIPNRGSSSTSIPGPNPKILQAALSGFHLSYGDNDHHVETISAAVGTSSSGQTAMITGVAELYDDTGHTATSAAAVDGILFASTDPTLGVYVVPTGNLQNREQEVKIGSPVSHIFALLSNFNAQYKRNADHHVKTIAASIVARRTSDSDTSVWCNGKATLTDNSGNTQDDSISHVSGYVIAY